MAAPTVSGNAVLARQYFADGFYPRGYRYDGLPTDHYLRRQLRRRCTYAVGELADVRHPSSAVGPCC